jgi:predicted transcriptional regulator
MSMCHRVAALDTIGVMRNFPHRCGFFRIAAPPSPRHEHPMDRTLSRRERQIMDVVYHRGRASAADVLEDLPDPPSYSSVRSALRLLEEKGALRHEIDGQRYVYLPTVPREKAQRTALGHLVRTFFNGSAEQVVNTLVEDSRLSPEELDRLSRLLAQARKRDR